MKRKYFFYLQPNVEFKGVKHFYQIYKKPIKNLKLTRRIVPNNTNVIIENFKDTDVEYIIKSKKEKNIKLILILTEFWNHNAQTINCFDYKFIFPKISLKILLKVFLILSFFKRNIFNRLINLRTKVGENKKKQKSKKEGFLYYLHNLVSWKRRYNNTLKVIPYVDLIVTSHPEILKHPKLKKIKKLYYPYLFSFRESKKKNIFGFGGASSDYRINFFNQLEKKNKDQKYRKNILEIKNELSKNSFIGNHEKNFHFFFSLHPKKNSIWPYSSPVRYIGSVNNGEIPIVFDNFKFNDYLSKILTLKCNNLDLRKFYQNRKEIKKK